MTGLVQFISSNFNHFVPPGIERQIFISSCILDYLGDRSASIRERMTLYSLKDRVNQGGMFVQWIGKIYTPSTISELPTNPDKQVIWAHLHDLICKVAVAAACYLTINASLYTSLVNLCSYSDKVSKLALPILSKIGSIPIPDFLPSARVIALAPAFMKLMQLMLVYLRFSIDSPSPVIETLEKRIGTFTHGLEFLWNLRYTVLFLGTSQTIYHATLKTVFTIFIETVCSWLVSNEALSPKNSLFLINAGNVLGKQLFYLDWPAIGFSSGLHAIYRSLFASHESYNIGKMEDLFDKASNLNGELEQLATYRKEISDYFREVHQATARGEISPDYAQALHSHLSQRCKDTLQIFLQNPSFETILMQGEHPCSEFQQIYGPQGLLFPDDFAWTTFKDILLQTHHLNWSLDSLSQLNQQLEKIITALKSAQDQQHLNEEQIYFFKNYLSKKLSQLFQDHIQFHLHDADFCQQNEKDLRDIFGKTGFLETISSPGKTLLLQHCFHLALFNLNLKWYFENQQALNQEQQQGCEYLILQQAKKDGVFSFEWNEMLKIPAFKKHLYKEKIEDPKNETERRKIVEEAFRQIDVFAGYIRENISIPDGFKFQTASLPLEISRLPHNIEELTVEEPTSLISIEHFPDETVGNLDTKQAILTLNEEVYSLEEKSGQSVYLKFCSQNNNAKNVHYADLEKIHEFNFASLSSGE